jgi:hypothetical protein
MLNRRDRMPGDTPILPHHGDLEQGAGLIGPELPRGLAEKNQEAKDLSGARHN